MKKVLVILLASLLLFSFTSCSNDNSSKVEEQKKEYEEKLQTEKDKQEAMIKAFEDFMDVYKNTDIRKFVDSYSRGQVLDFSKQGTVNATLSNLACPDVNAQSILDYGLVDFIEEGQLLADASYAILNEPAPSGTVSGTINDKDNLDLTFTDNRFTLSYTLIGKDYKIVSSNNKLAVTLSGTYKEETTDEKHVVDYNITINGKTFQLSYTYDNKTDKVTAASVNGTDVEVRLFNADGLSLVD